MHYIFLIVALVLNAAANVFMKVGATKLGDMRGMDVLEVIGKLATNYNLIFGVIFFALNVIFYALALTRINLSVAYPIMTAGGFLIISVISVLFLRESFSWVQILGIVLISIGIVLVAYHLK